MTVAHSQTEAPGSGQLPGASAHLDVMGKDMIAENRAEGQCCSALGANWESSSRSFSVKVSIRGLRISST